MTWKCLCYFCLCYFSIQFCTFLIFMANPVQHSGEPRVSVNFQGHVPIVLSFLYVFIVQNCSFPNPNLSVMVCGLQIGVYRNEGEVLLRLIQGCAGYTSPLDPISFIFPSGKFWIRHWCVLHLVLENCTSQNVTVVCFMFKFSTGFSM